MYILTFITWYSRLVPVLGWIANEARCCCVLERRWVYSQSSDTQKKSMLGFRFMIVKFRTSSSDTYCQVEPCTRSVHKDGWQVRNCDLTSFVRFSVRFSLYSSWKSKRYWGHIRKKSCVQGLSLTTFPEDATFIPKFPGKTPLGKSLSTTATSIISSQPFWLG